MIYGIYYILYITEYLADKYILYIVYDSLDSWLRDTSGRDREAIGVSPIPPLREAAPYGHMNYSTISSATWTGPSTR
jgi:hypothetical protein